MFGNEFFPTPRKVVDQMLEPYLVRGNLPADLAILEPSAGKGDIAERLDMLRNGRHPYSSSAEGIHCLEANFDLQAILREKGFAVVGDDFLSFTGEAYLYDLIVMNPPFSQGARHLLHAWEILRRGDIVCLLNRETIDNPYTQERQLLAGLIEVHGSVENVGTPFALAERKTNVEVCIVRLTKNEDIGIDGLFNEAEFQRCVTPGNDVPLINENQVAHRNAIRRMTDAYNATLESFAGAAKAMRELTFYGGDFISNRGTEDVKDFFFKAISSSKGLISGNKAEFSGWFRGAYNEFAEQVRAAAWNRVFQQTEMARFMTKKVREEFRALQKRKQTTEFTEENIMAFIQTLLQNSDKIAQSAVSEAFDLMTRFHEENRVHIEGWKTNDAWRVKKKFILPYVVSHEWGRFQVSFRSEECLSDIDRGIALLEGKPFDRIKTIHNAIREAIANGETTCESEFFTIKFYKKGTAHFQFKDAGVWERFNVAACEGKNWLPGVKGASAA